KIPPFQRHSNAPITSEWHVEVDPQVDAQALVVRELHERLRGVPAKATAAAPGTVRPAPTLLHIRHVRR
ncbi:MAG: hypothetical protein IKH04_10980, partial [Kiritimatiellae bacterium]|nr:hypothetical protein [Kiritimatiellia bacterium]